MSQIHFEQVRSQAAKHANEEDASLWRWFCGLYDEGRLRWCRSHEGWLVSVDHKHLATESDFDRAIRVARQRFFSGGRRQTKEG
jgi:glutamate-1-semialdehyde aminotransferase